MCISWNSIHLKAKFFFCYITCKYKSTFSSFLKSVWNRKNKQQCWKNPMTVSLKWLSYKNKSKIQQKFFCHIYLRSMWPKANIIISNFRIRFLTLNRKIQPPEEGSTQSFWWFYLCCKFRMFKGQLCIFHETLLPLLLCHHIPHFIFFILFYFYFQILLLYFVNILGAFW